jgi:hypothetical protein
MTLDTAAIDPTSREEHERPPRRSPRAASFAATLLGAATDAAAGLADEARRFGTGLGLAALFGAALGLRAGGLSIPHHALGVAAGIVAASAASVPAFAIVLGLVDAPIDARALTRATARAVAKTGLLLGGFAPAAAMYVVTVEDAITVSIVGAGGLLIAGLVGMGTFARDLAPSIAAAPARTRQILRPAMPALLLFSAVLAARVFWLALPVLGGGK